MMNISVTFRAALFICLTSSFCLLLAETKPLQLKNSKQENAALKENRQNPTLKENLFLNKSPKALVPSAKAVNPSAKALVPSAKALAPMAKSLAISRSPASASASVPSSAASAPSSVASTPSKASTNLNADDNIKMILKDIVGMILSKQIDAKVIDNDGFNRLDSHPISPFSTTESTRSAAAAAGSAAASPKDPTISRIWEELKRDIAWETEAMKEQFEKLEGAILRRVRSFIDTRDEEEDEEKDEDDKNIETAISTSKFALQGDQHLGHLGKQRRQNDGDDDENDYRYQPHQPQQPQMQKEDADVPRVTRHVNPWLPPTMPAEIGRFIEKKARKKGAKGRGKRNLLTDLISPHMRWDEGNSGGGGGTKLTYQQFKTIAKQLIKRLKIERQLVNGAERETADAIISALEELLVADEAFVTALLNS